MGGMDTELMSAPCLGDELNSWMFTSMYALKMGYAGPTVGGANRLFRAFLRIAPEGETNGARRDLNRLRQNRFVALADLSLGNLLAELCMGRW